MTAGLAGLRSDLVPVAGEVLRRVDDHGAAAVLDAPERVDLGREQVLGPPDRMIRRKRPKLIFLLGEDLLDQPLEAPVEFAAAATGLGEDEAPLLDELAEVLLGRWRRTPARGGR